MSFDFVPGEVYEFDDLPAQEREDAIQQFETDLSLDPKDFSYRFHIVPNDILEKVMLKKHFSKSMAEMWGAFQEAGELEKIDALGASIEDQGFVFVPIGAEGWHRSLAMLRLGYDLPYLQAIQKKKSLARSDKVADWKKREIVPPTYLKGLL